MADTARPRARNPPHRHHASRSPAFRRAGISEYFELLLAMAEPVEKVVHAHDRRSGARPEQPCSPGCGAASASMADRRTGLRAAIAQATASAPRPPQDGAGIELEIFRVLGNCVQESFRLHGKGGP
jgi:hypothetical protein